MSCHRFESRHACLEQCSAMKETTLGQSIGHQTVAPGARRSNEQFSSFRQRKGTVNGQQKWVKIIWRKRKEPMLLKHGGVCSFICLSIYTYLSINLSVCLYVCMCVCMYVCLSVCLPANLPVLYCIVFKYLYKAPQQPWAIRGAFGSISSKKRDKF